jgi:hypothetical protein
MQRPSAGAATLRLVVVETMVNQAVGFGLRLWRRVLRLSMRMLVFRAIQLLELHDDGVGVFGQPLFYPLGRKPGWTIIADQYIGVASIKLM